MLPKLSLMLLGVIAGGLIAEVAVRLLDLAPQVATIQKGRFRLSQNPRLGYEPTPSLYYEGEDLSYYDYRGSETNELGYRDYDHPLEAPAGSLRIVALGDSITSGLGVADHAETFPATLEAEWRYMGSRVPS